MVMLRAPVSMVQSHLLYKNGQHNQKAYIIIMTKVLSLHSHEVAIGMVKNVAQITILIGPLINYFLTWLNVTDNVSNFI